MGFEIQNYISRTHEMKNRILSKNEGCLFFLLPKIHQLPEYYMMFARKKYFFSLEFGGGATALPAPRLLRLWPLITVPTPRHRAARIDGFVGFG